MNIKKAINRKAAYAMGNKWQDFATFIPANSMKLSYEEILEKIK